MTDLVPDGIEAFIQTHPLLYRKLCFWAEKRGAQDAAMEVQEYVTQLILQADPDRDNSDLLSRWTERLSPQERNALASLNRVAIGDTSFAPQWYDLESGEYSVANEPIVQEISFEGQQQGVITRNRYGCLVLNCDWMMIVDVDIAAPQQDKSQDCVSSSQVALSQEQAIAAVESLVQQFPQLGFRVYRTRNGLRHLCTTQLFDPLDPATHRIMSSLYVDPLYLKLCRFQACFRARLTPKPWRVDAKYREQFIQGPMTWLMLPHSSPYAVGHLIEVLGKSEILPQFEPLIETHDSYCRVSRLGLELA